MIDAISNLLVPGPSGPPLAVPDTGSGSGPVPAFDGLLGELLAPPGDVADAAGLPAGRQLIAGDGKEMPAGGPAGAMIAAETDPGVPAVDQDPAQEPALAWLLPSATTTEPTLQAPAADKAGTPRTATVARLRASAASILLPDAASSTTDAGETTVPRGPHGAAADADRPDDAAGATPEPNATPLAIIPIALPPVLEPAAQPTASNATKAPTARPETLPPSTGGAAAAGLTTDQTDGVLPSQTAAVRDASSRDPAILAVIAAAMPTQEPLPAPNVGNGGANSAVVPETPVAAVQPAVPEITRAPVRGAARARMPVVIAANSAAESTGTATTSAAHTATDPLVREAIIPPRPLAFAAQTGVASIVLRAPSADAPASPVTGIDLAHAAGLHRMIDHIEALRDAAPLDSWSRETRIRLVPDSLGPVDVAVRREGDAVQVHFTASEAATRQLIADAQPRLAELADARGVRIDRATVDGGGAGGPSSNPFAGSAQGQAQPDAHGRSQRPASAARANPEPIRAARADTSESTDHRIA